MFNKFIDIKPIREYINLNKIDLERYYKRNDILWIVWPTFDQFKTDFYKKEDDNG